MEKEIAITAVAEAVFDTLVMEDNTEVKSGEVCSHKNKSAEVPIAKFENVPAKVEPEPLLENPSGYTILTSKYNQRYCLLKG